MNTQLDTLPGHVDGIVGLFPLTLQCRTCGAIHKDDGQNIAVAIMLSGYHFHTCDGREGKRQCPDCLDAAKRSCERTHD